MYAHYRKHGRTLPWRKIRDPYRILVSEIMLQQTQVERVIPFYKKFLKRFPTPRSLARARLADVLKEWQGLGYNRRAKYLHKASSSIAKRGFPKQTAEIESLPGVGHYTARAIAAFAFNRPEVFVETNIRTVFICFCFPNRKKVSDKEILPLVTQAFKESRMHPRDFYAGLMDYGAYLKQRGIQLNSRSAHYVRQSRFEGSARQLRGAILRELLKHSTTLGALLRHVPRSKEEVVRELSRLAAEGLVKLRGRYFSIPD